MHHFQNPFRGTGMDPALLDDVPAPSVDAAAPETLLARCPAYEQTPLITLEGFGGAGHVFVKDERTRMGLGSFKALGAAYVIAHQAAQTGAADMKTALAGQTFVTASAGNHGLSVAAGANLFGAKAVIYLAEAVPEGFAERLRAMGAGVERLGTSYEESMEGAQKAATDNGWTLLSDSSWPGYFELSHRLMEGYLAMAAETTRQMQSAPTHIFLQAGVGGLAGACAAYFRHVWGDGPQIIVVEPETAPALIASIKAGKPVIAPGPVSNMGRLDCKEPSLIALRGLSRDADVFVTLTEEEATEAMPALAAAGLATSTSGGAGLVALMQGIDGIDASSEVLCILSEGDED